MFGYKEKVCQYRQFPISHGETEQQIKSFAHEKTG